jgi:transcriptional regulator of acetoin/glycerol metabolism
MGIKKLGREIQKNGVKAERVNMMGSEVTFRREGQNNLQESCIDHIITGETGSGKEFFAKALHKSSERRDGPFIPVNCAAIPESLIESELFGYTAGSFSGAATKGKRGLIQEADGGTLFLDEIGDMPKPLQARLLRVLSEREVLPIGATQAVPVNIRVVAATHCDLENLVVAGLFRDDLYYRLCGAHFTLPPLRERKDIAWVIDRVLAINAKQNASPFVPELDEEARKILMRHRWPGNLRELNNVIAFATSVSSEKLISAVDLPEYLLSTERFSELDLPVDTDSVFDHEKSRLLALLRGCRWNVTAAAQQMGISRVTIYKKMKRYNVKPPI